jgi:ABC-type transport system involved in multi-copper enzyme maturation permease subunit
MIAMVQSVASVFRRAARPRNPILGKEMICSSRRRRFYLLRAVYIVAMGLFVVLTWRSQTALLKEAISGGSGNATAVSSRMADVGKNIVLTITWFQFVAAQLVAVLLLSNAINGEIQKRTLPILLSTPVTYFQLSLGKVLGGIWQVLILLLISLPLLALVRVMGGVEWTMVLASLAATISTAFLCAAVGFHFSILFRQPYGVMLLSVLSVIGYYLLAWVVWPILIGMALYRVLNFARNRQRRATPLGEGLRRTLAIATAVGLYVWWIVERAVEPTIIANPCFGIYTLCDSLLNPASWAAGMENYVALGALVNIAVGLYVLGRSSAKIRGIAYTRAWGEWTPGGAQIDLLTATAALADLTSKARPTPRSEVTDVVEMVAPQQAKDVLYGRIERLGSPVIWKDLHGSLVRNDIVRFFVVFMPLGLVFVLYFAMLISESFRRVGTHAVITSVCMTVGVFLTAILSGMTITIERQARSWPILQTTTLTGWQILWGKAVAVVWRVMPIWIVLFGHMVLFTLLGQIHPLALLLTIMLVLAANAFIIGGGLLLGTYLRQTTIAAGACLAIPLLLWLLLPGGVRLVADAAQSADVSPRSAQGPGVWDTLRDVDLHLVSPIQQAYTMVNGCPGAFGKDEDAKLGFRLLRPSVYWGDARQSASSAFLVCLCTLVVYGSAGLAMSACAVRRFRRHAF